jgi:PAS domain S-box-containing protein
MTRSLKKKFSGKKRSRSGDPALLPATAHEERLRLAMREAVEATAKFRAVFDQSAIFAGIMSLDGVVMDANQICLEACGYRKDEVVGRPFWEAGWWRGKPDAQEKVRSATKQAAQGTPYQEQLPYVWADGSERVVDFALHPIRDDQGQVIFLHPTGIDITDRKLSEEKLRKLTENLESEVRARTKELEDRNADIVRQSNLLRVLSRRLMAVQDEERRRIARELHDSAGQLLSVLSINLSAVARQAKLTAPELGDQTEECHRIVEQLTQEIRTMSYLLHPPLLEELGLSAALDWYVKGLNERAGMDIRLDIPKKFGRLPDDLELVVFRVVQECLTNTHRHSGSKTASIRLLMQNGALTLEVKDQGRGMPAEKLAEILAHGSGVGIQGIRERLRPYEGNMRIQSGANGTTISVTLQVPRARASAAQA